MKVLRIFVTNEETNEWKCFCPNNIVLEINLDKTGEFACGLKCFSWSDIWIVRVDSANNVHYHKSQCMFEKNQCVFLLFKDISIPVCNSQNRKFRIRSMQSGLFKVLYGIAVIYMILEWFIALWLNGGSGRPGLNNIFEPIPILVFVKE